VEIWVGTYPNPTVSKIQGNPVAACALVAGDAGKVYRWSGSQFQAAYLTVGDLKTNLGAAQFPANCGANQTLTWSSITDTFNCTNINGVPPANITGLAPSATTDTTNANNIYRFSATLLSNPFLVLFSH
jgi:hypothetical protein